MFCPNCGTDCADANFCMNCGTQLKKSKIPCAEETNITYDIPVGEYKAWVGTIRLEKDAVIVSKKIHFKHYETRIPYDQIAALCCVRPSRHPCEIADLTIRGKEDADVSVPPHDALGDKTTISFEADKYIFYHIYYLLKSLAPIDAKCSMVITHNKKAKTAVLPEGTNLDTYFERFNPCRDQALDALCKETKVSFLRGWAIIDKIFDAHQEKLYSMDPTMIIRDLNWAIKKICPEKNEWLKKKKALTAAGVDHCPRCLCTEFTVEKRGYSGTSGLIGNRVVPIAGALAGFIGAEDPVFVCLKCGYRRG